MLSKCPPSLSDHLAISNRRFLAQNFLRLFSASPPQFRAFFFWQKQSRKKAGPLHNLFPGLRHTELQSPVTKYTFFSAPRFRFWPIFQRWLGRQHTPGMVSRIHNPNLPPIRLLKVVFAFFASSFPQIPPSLTSSILESLVFDFSLDALLDVSRFRRCCPPPKPDAALRLTWLVIRPLLLPWVLP